MAITQHDSWKSPDKTFVLSSLQKWFLKQKKLTMIIGCVPKIDKDQFMKGISLMFADLNLSINSFEAP